MADARKPFPQFNGFRSFVIDELSRRKTTYPTSISVPFVRLTSCLVEPKLNYVYFSLGLHGFDEGADVDIFSESYGNKRESVGYAYDMSKRINGKMAKKIISADQLTLDDFTNLPSGIFNDLTSTFVQSDRSNLFNTAQTIYAGGAHPIPGITSVTVHQYNLGFPIRTEIEWKCYNRAQLEFLRHHFLTAGNYVVVEWGQQFSNKTNSKILDFSDESTIRTTLVDSVLRGRQYIIDEWVTPNDGNYNFTVGKISNFTVDIDNRTNMYTCKTTVISTGEKMYGISMDTTFVKSFAEDNTKEQTSINTMRDFFQIGLKFDTLINQNSTDPTLVAGNYANWSKTNKNINAKNSDLKNISFNPEDYRFVSWKFFTTILIPELFKLIEHPNAENDFDKIANFWVDPSMDTSDPELQDWIGDNEFLRSTEPDTMLIIKQTMPLVPSAFSGAGTFGDATGYRGKLSSGIWLNTGMIRQCFMEAETFERGLTGVLLRMNGATTNFWGLRLFWDEEYAKFKIIDMKYTDTRNLPAFWKFNDGSTGETLSVKLDSAFPPELISQMGLFARYKTETQATQQDLLKKYPLIGSTSTFVFSVNYTSFHDILGPDITAKLQGNTFGTLGDSLGARSLEDDNPTTKAKVINVSYTPSSATVTDGSRPVPGANLGIPNVKTADFVSGRDATVVSGVRSSVKALASKVTNVTAIYKGTDKLDPTFKSRLDNLFSKIESTGHKAMVFETYRTPERQKFLYSQGRDGNPGPIVTKTLHSNHILGMAADIRIDGSDSATENFYSTLSQLCSQVGLQTIGAWDPGHVELVGIPKPSSAEWDTYLNGENSVQDVRDSTSVDKTDPPPAGINLTPQQTETLNTEADKEKIDSINTRFGPGMLPLIEPMQSTLLNKITRHGIENYPKPNGYIGGFPTTATATVECLGIGGLSLSDGFFVDKLPFIFERHGVFQTVELTDTITERGWITNVRGVFKLCWLDGAGHPLPPITTK